MYHFNNFCYGIEVNKNKKLLSLLEEYDVEYQCIVYIPGKWSTNPRENGPLTFA